MIKLASLNSTVTKKDTVGQRLDPKLLRIIFRFSNPDLTQIKLL